MFIETHLGDLSKENLRYIRERVSAAINRGETQDIDIILGQSTGYPKRVILKPSQTTLKTIDFYLEK